MPPNVDHVVFLLGSDLLIIDPGKEGNPFGHTYVNNTIVEYFLSNSRDVVYKEALVHKATVFYRSHRIVRQMILTTPVYTITMDEVRKSAHNFVNLEIEVVGTPVKPTGLLGQSLYLSQNDLDNNQPTYMLENGVSIYRQLL